MVEMHDPSDVQLLRDYAERGHEAAFRELVGRHTDLVYSAALRQVNSADVAGDIAQGVFTDLARKARQMAEQMAGNQSLAGWLHRSTRYAALNHWRDTRRRITNERLAMEQLLINSEPAQDWERIRPMVDEALDSLGDEDREAILLRYFKNQDFRAVGLALGISDDAAQKRVSRAMDRLRAFFSKRNVTIGVVGLGALISANAVQAAPVGLAAAISGAAVLSGTAASASTSTVTTVTKIIAMNTMQKTLIVAALAVVAVGWIYEGYQASQLSEQNRTLQLALQHAPQPEQLEELQRERDDATKRMVALSDELARVKKNSSEVLRLRGEMGVLRREKSDAENQTFLNKAAADPKAWAAMRENQKQSMSATYSKLAKRLKLTPEQKDQFNDLLADHVMDNLKLATQALQEHKSQTEVRQIFSGSETAFQGSVQALLGQDGLNQYQDYTRNLGSTLFVDGFASSLTGDRATVADKKNRLMQAMQDATQSELADAGLPADYQTLTMLNFGNWASEDEAEQSFQLKDKILGDAAERASAFLTPEELNLFQKTRANSIQFSRNLLLVQRKVLVPASK